jgi:hypothetical protein
LSALAPQISLYTFTLGRTFYLNRTLLSVMRAATTYPGRLEHHLCYQGVDPAPETLSLIEDCDLENLRFEIHRWPENIGLQVGMNRIVPKLPGDWIIKIDDDCLIHSASFFEHVAAVARLEPQAMFSPYPVGLIGTPGGPAGRSHRVAYAEEMDTWYTLRRVDHVGGFCRISPAATVRAWRLEPGADADVRNEDTQYSRLCREQGIPMYYLENALVVEHQESTLGQEARYPAYFERRRALEPRGVARLARRIARALARRLSGRP